MDFGLRWSEDALLVDLFLRVRFVDSTVDERTLLRTYAYISNKKCAHIYVQLFAFLMRNVRTST